MRRYWILAAVLAGGCLASNGLEYEAMSETNQYHIARIRKGMSQKQVLAIMHKPYSYESFEVDEDVYDVWFYVTRTTVLDQTRMVPQNLTPLTFKNGVLVGTGYQWYYFAMREQAKEASLEKPQTEKPKTQKEEDVEFEKSLQKIQKTNSAPKQIQNKDQGKEKLPQNVHIISHAEIETKSSLKSKSAHMAASITEFSNLKLGMTESEVMNRLGNAQEKEVIRDGEDIYHIWFYRVGKTMIPLTFKNKILVGKTEEEYQKIKEKCTDCYNKEGERMEQDASEQNFDYW